MSGDLRTGSHAQHQVLRAEGAARRLHGVLVDDRGPRVEDVLDVELLLGLPVHERVCAAPPGQEQPHHLQDARAGGVELREEQLVGEPPHAVELLGRLGEQVVRHAGLVRARAAEERPRVDDQRPSTHRPHVGRAEPTAGAAAHEDGVVDRIGVVRHVEDRLRVRIGEAALDQRDPLGEVGVLVPDVHRYSSTAWASTAASAAVNPSRRALIAVRTASAAAPHSFAMPRTTSGRRATAGVPAAHDRLGIERGGEVQPRHRRRGDPGLGGGGVEVLAGEVDPAQSLGRGPAHGRADQVVGRAVVQPERGHEVLGEVGGLREPAVERVAHAVGVHRELGDHARHQPRCARRQVQRPRHLAVGEDQVVAARGRALGQREHAGRAADEHPGLAAHHRQRVRVALLRHEHRRTGVAFARGPPSRTRRWRRSPGPRRGGRAS